MDDDKPILTINSHGKNILCNTRSLGSKVGHYIKLDLTYATIPTFGGEERRL